MACDDVIEAAVRVTTSFPRKSIAVDEVVVPTAR